MTLWLVLTLMTVVAIYIVAEPFLCKEGEHRSAFAGEVAVFRDQLKEVDRDAANGLIDAGEAETARAEIKRRMLKADCEKDATAAPLSTGRPRFASAAAVAGMVVLASVSVYAVKGSPRLSASGEVGPTPLELAAMGRVVADMEARQHSTATERPTIDAMITGLVDRLKKSPNDPEGWRILGWCYFKTERFAEAASAYAKAVELRPGVASMRTSWGEALVKAAGGRVTDKAGMIFDEALRLDGRDRRARYFRGLAKEQAGDKGAALNEWIALLDDVPGDEEWASDLKQRIAELAFDINFNAVPKIRPPDVAAGNQRDGIAR
jgi:cytochrome c-type biogenesis protein CcmH